ncbi:MAG: hypothetical protein L6Q37_17550, partial [Bdellovibrionaceae bacterium]|nr:hypothetical protein [Pseudobdellovibrionaceae bacterium]
QSASPENDDELRAAQLSVYYENLYRTPSAISNKMNENQIVLMHSSHIQEYVLATKFDCTIIHRSSQIEFRSILPAKGSGGTEIKLGAITIFDTINSHPLANLKSKLETLGFEIKTVEYYDC